MNRPRIIIDTHIPYIKGVLDLAARTEYLEPREITRQAIQHADGLIIRTRTHCNEALLDGTNVRMIATATIGTDHIDLAYCHNHGITVANAPGCNARSVSQWVAAVLATDGPRGRTIGIIGYGHVGHEVAVIARMFGLRVLIYDPLIPPERESVSLDTLCRHADIITFHTPLTHTPPHPTYMMADSRFFNQTKPDALIINAARGGIIDEQALINHLDAHPEARAAIDCWQNEPHINKELLSKALIATPHIAGYSADGKMNGTRAAVTAICRHFQIEPGPIKGLEPALPTYTTTAGLAQSILHNYNITSESEALKARPDRFEAFRAEYPTRRDITYRIAENQ